MGQKINPKGFRLVTNQKYLSNFYKSKAEYPLSIEEDYKIRNLVQNSFEKYLTLSNIKINRTHNEISKEEFVNIIICALYPRKKQAVDFMLHVFPNFKIEKEKLKKGGDRSSIPIILKRIFFRFKLFRRRITRQILKHGLKIFLQTLRIERKKNYNIKIKFIRSQFEDASIIAKFIAKEMNKRSPYRRVMKTVINKIKAVRRYSNVKGLKIQISGRLNGIEIARTEWKRFGSIPLHTLNADIDYTHEFVNTKFGVIGIKVWLYKSLNQKI